MLDMRKGVNLLRQKKKTVKKTGLVLKEIKEQYPNFDYFGRYTIAGTMVNVFIQSGTTRGKAKGALAPPTLPQSIRKLNPK